MTHDATPQTAPSAARYPARIQAGGPQAMARYDDLTRRFATEDGKAGPATLYDPEIDLILYAVGNGPIPPGLLQSPVPPDKE